MSEYEGKYLHRLIDAANKQMNKEAIKARDTADKYLHTDIWVSADGPVPARVAFVGESPGMTEVVTGVPFSGKSGEELNNYYLPVAGLSRKNVYITNLSKKHVEEPDKQMVEDWYLPLMHELQEVQPEIVVTLGKYAAWAFMDDEPTMEQIHGIPYDAVNHYNQKCIVLPCFHPAAGLHNEEMQKYIYWDFQQLKLLLRGQLKGRCYSDLRNGGVYKLNASLTNGSHPIGIDTETYPDGKPWGYSWSHGRGDGWVARKGEGNISVTSAVLHNSLYDYGVLQDLDVEIGNFTDTMLMAHLLCIEPKGLKALAKRHCRMQMDSYMDIVGPVNAEMTLMVIDAIALHNPDSNLQKLAKRAMSDYAKGKDVMPRYKTWVKRGLVKPIEAASLDDVPEEVSTRYAARDAHATMEIYPILKSKVEDMKLTAALELDCAVVPMLVAMQRNGMRVDSEKLKALGFVVKMELEGLRVGVEKYSSEPYFNINSKAQVSDLLFNTLRLPPTKKTRSGARPSVAKGVLEQLKDKHPVVPLLIKHSELEKIRNTYVTQLPKFIKDGRIHPNFSLIATPTGRLATKQPNLLAQPTKSEMGRKIRECFIASEGYTMVSWDLDQIELRVLAHESNDPAMIKILSDPHRHIHKETCCHIFGIAVGNITKDMYQYLSAKIVSFAIPYGVSAIGLQSQLGAMGVHKDLAYSKALIKDWYKLYPKVYDYHELVKSQARMRGYVRSPLGRIRYVPGIRSTVAKIRARCIRQAINFPIQAGAQEVLKRGMRDMWVLLKSTTDIVKPLLQVHDELLFEIDNITLGHGDIQKAIAGFMENAIKLRVPIRTTMNQGATWADLK